MALPRICTRSTRTRAYARDNSMNKLKPNELINEVMAVLKENYNLKMEVKSLKKKIASLEAQKELLNTQHKMLVMNTNFFKSL